MTNILPMSNIQVYGLENAIRVSKYPMLPNIEDATEDIVPRTCKLGSCKTGTGHDQFLTGIVVQFDLTFTVKAWVEIERYKFMDFISSQSTMHRIAKFDYDTCYNPYVDQRVIAIMKEKVDEYNNLVENRPDPKEFVYETMLDEKYLEILYTNPDGFTLTAGMTTNYRQLKTIYQQRKNHRLPEWRAFCKQCEELPHFMELCFSGKGEE